MSDAEASPEDPLLVSARREMVIALGMWALAAACTLGVSITWGYDRDPKTLTFVLGFPDWVFWGIIVPWAGSTIVAAIFAMGYMQDGPLEPEEPSPPTD
jgi:hypothetical protein